MSTDLSLNNGKKAVVHVDMDGARHIYKYHGWDYNFNDDPLFESGFRNLLDFLDQNNIKATLFTIASDLDDPQKLDLFTEAVKKGHEIASHSLSHPKFNKLNENEKRIEIEGSREKIESLLGVTVKGFRTPSYLIDRDVLELLDEYGYEYDSSVFPTPQFANLLETTSLLDKPYRPLYDRELIELPLPQYKPAPFPFHPSYSLILGKRYFEWGFNRFQKNNFPFVLLFHLTDFAEKLPAERLDGLYSRLYTLSHKNAEIKIKHCRSILEKVNEQYQIVQTSELLRELKEELKTKEPTILSISTTHETGASIFQGSKLQAAVSEERLDRIKFSTHYPPHRSIEEVINVSNVNPGEIEHVIVSGLPTLKLLPRMFKGQLRDFLEFHGFIDYFPHFNKILYRAFYFYRTLSYKSILSMLKKKYGVQPKIHFVEHHLCHASAVYRTAPFDNALIVTADGVGDDISLTISIGKNGRITRIKEIAYPHSFGQFYTACTQVLGFRGGRHEGKITGLSGFGKVDDDLYNKVKSTIRKSGPEFALDKRYYSEGIVHGFSLSKMKKGESLFDVLQYRNFKKPLKKLLKGYSREDVAAVFQKLLEEEVAKVVRPYAEKIGFKNLALCGGLFANVKLNASLKQDLNMDQVYIFPHMGDGGLSVGAALEFLQSQPRAFNDVYWGPDFKEERLEKALEEAGIHGLHYQKETNIEKKVAELLVEKKVIARFNGKMEFGPRALGNRSILYHAGDPEANNWLNKRLHRTEFMPFAPIVLVEKADILFENFKGKEHACKFMTIIVDCNKWTKDNCPAIVHVDGTARPQFVSEEINPSVYKILNYYESLTGIPLLVNTSFNMHEEPIVCTPEDAVRAFISSRLDYLAMGPYLAWLE